MRDGRHLMQNDGMGGGVYWPCCDEFHAHAVGCALKGRVMPVPLWKMEQDHAAWFHGVAEHTNYRYGDTATSNG